MARRPRRVTGRPREENINKAAKRRAVSGQARGFHFLIEGRARARGLVVPVVVAEGLDRYLRVVVAAAASGEEAAPVAELARRGARAREVEGRN